MLCAQLWVPSIWLNSNEKYINNFTIKGKQELPKNIGL